MLAGEHGMQFLDEGLRIIFCIDREQCFSYSFFIRQVTEASHESSVSVPELRLDEQLRFWQSRSQGTLHQDESIVEEGISHTARSPLEPITTGEHDRSNRSSAEF